MTTIQVFSKPKLRNPLLVEGLPGVGNIGRVTVGYLIKELNAVKFADLYSEHFFPFVMLHDNYRTHLLKNEFHYVKAKKPGQRDLILLVGDCQSLSPNGHYEVAEKILDFVRSHGCKEIITIGGLATGEIEQTGRTLGAVTDDSLLKKYKNLGIDFTAGEKVGYIVGAAGLLLGIGKEKGMAGLCLLGETAGFPIVTDPKAAETVLTTLAKLLKIRIDMKNLEERVHEMEHFIKKVEALQRKALQQIGKDETKAPVSEKEQLRYIG